jgi:hypothetical protein
LRKFEPWRAVLLVGRARDQSTAERDDRTWLKPRPFFAWQASFCAPFDLIRVNVASIDKKHSAFATAQSDSVVTRPSQQLFRPERKVTTLTVCAALEILPWLDRRANNAIGSSRFLECIDIIGPMTGDQVRSRKGRRVSPQNMFAWSVRITEPVKMSAHAAGKVSVFSRVIVSIPQHEQDFSTLGFDEPDEFATKCGIIDMPKRILKIIQQNDSAVEV